MKKLDDVLVGMHIATACKRLAAAAPAWMEFNGVRVEARGGESPEDLMATWQRGMDVAGAEHERKRRAFEATPEGQRQSAEAKRKRDEEERLQRESLASVEASGIRARYPFRDGMREISGFGGGYEAACRTMIYAGLLWLEAHPEAAPIQHEADRKAFEKAILRAEPGCSGAMMGAACSHAMYVHTNGYEAWAAKLIEEGRRRIANGPS